MLDPPVQAEKDGAVRAFGIDEQLHGGAVRVGALVGNQLDVVILETTGCLAVTADSEQDGTFYFPAFCICQRSGESVLSCLARLELVGGIGVSGGFYFPSLDFFFSHLAVLVRGDAVEG